HVSRTMLKDDQQPVEARPANDFRGNERAEVKPASVQHLAFAQPLFEFFHSVFISWEICQQVPSTSANPQHPLPPQENYYSVSVLSLSCRSSSKLSEMSGRLSH